MRSPLSARTLTKLQRHIRSTSRMGSTVPWGRAYDLDAEVLLLGVGHDANTTVHLAENMAGVRYKLPKYATVLRNGQPIREYYREVDHCCANFALLDSWLEARGHQQRGFIAGAPARLVSARDVVVAGQHGTVTPNQTFSAVSTQMEHARCRSEVPTAGSFRRQDR
jgi:aminoglycoside N3'-acetyltransferase